jgi:hypothetical protein
MKHAPLVGLLLFAAACVSRVETPPPLPPSPPPSSIGGNTGAGGGVMTSRFDAGPTTFQPPSVLTDGGAAAETDACSNVRPLCDDPLGCAPTYEQQLMATLGACSCADPDGGSSSFPPCSGQAGACGGYHVVVSDGPFDSLTCIYSGLDQLVSATHCAEQELACGSSCLYCGHHPFVLGDFCDPTQVPKLCGGGG